MSLYERGKSWYYDFQYCGERYTGCVGPGSKTVTREILATKKAEPWQGCTSHRPRNRARAWMNSWSKSPSHTVAPIIGKPPLKPLVITTLHTGFRASELCSLTWKGVNSRRRTITVRAAYVKNGESWTVQMNEVLTATLKAVKLQ